MALAPNKSARPQARVTPEERQAEYRKQGEQFGNMEFEVDLAQNQDLVARLGMDATRARVVYKPLSAAGIYIPADSEGGSEQLRRLTGDGFNADTVITTGDWAASKKVWNHEFRHRGMGIIRDNFSEQEVAARYGKDAAGLIFGDRYEEYLVDDADNMLPPERLPDGMSEDQLDDKTEGLTADSKGKVRLANMILADLALEVLEADGRPAPALRRESPKQAFDRRAQYTDIDKRQARGFLARLLFGGD